MGLRTRLCAGRLGVELSALLCLTLAVGCGEQNFPEKPSNGVVGNGGEAGAGVSGGSGANGMGGSGGAETAPEKGARGENMVFALPAPTNALACSTGTDCGSGFCADGVCCDSACTGTCQACTAAKKGSGADGVCGPIKFDTNPDNECAIGSACDGKGVCKFYNGVPCGPGGNQCLAYCVDGFCCGNVCTGACESCSAAEKGGGVDGACGPIAAGTDPDNECSPDTCDGAGKCKPIGGACSSNAQCGPGGSCVDGVCCDSACTGTCQACTAAKKGSGVDGVCGPIKFDTNPDNECAIGSACDGQGTCKFYNGVPCGPGGNQCLAYCVDGFCCGNVCTGPCESCSAAEKGGGDNGVCGLVAPGTVCPGGTCNGAGQCGGCVPAPETCNGTDDNCNGQIDEGLGSTSCGVGACQTTTQNCVNGQPQTCTPLPAAPNETCSNGIDDDCNGTIDDPAQCPPSPPILAICLSECDNQAPDGTCSLTESSFTCSQDCACGDGLCSGTEDSKNCPADCKILNDAVGFCGNGYCEAFEVDRPNKVILCEKDCWNKAIPTPPGTLCGDGNCSGAETSEQCAADCGNKTTYTNGDGNCETGESRFNSFDCPQNLEKGIVLESPNGSACDGYALIDRFADGNGNAETHTVTECSESCGAAPWMVTPNYSGTDWNGTQVLTHDCITCTITGAPIPNIVAEYYYYYPGVNYGWATLGTTYEMNQNPNDCDTAMREYNYYPAYGYGYTLTPLEWEKTGEKQCNGNCNVYDCYGITTSQQFGTVSLWKPAIAPWSILEPDCQ